MSDPQGTSIEPAAKPSTGGGFGRLAASVGLGISSVIAMMAFGEKVQFSAAWAGVVGSVVTGGLLLAGNWLTQRTTLQAKQIDDRALLTSQLLERQKTEDVVTDKRVERLEKVTATLQRREVMFIRLFASTMAEMKAMVDAVMDAKEEIEKDVPDLAVVRRRIDRLARSMSHLADEIEAQYIQLFGDVVIKWAEHMEEEVESEDELRGQDPVKQPPSKAGV
jgi:hypothetical protein